MLIMSTIRLHYILQSRPEIKIWWKSY